MAATWEGMISFGLQHFRRAGVALSFVIAAWLPLAASALEQCPLRFDELTTGLPSACLFVGEFDSDCGGPAMAVFAGDGDAMVVSLVAPSTGQPVFIPAHVISATDGKLVRWQPDLQLAAAPSVGTVRLEGGGEQLRLRLSAGGVVAGTCTVREFVGRYVGMAPDGAPQTALATAN
ncbi:MAG: hypothetical protein ABI629_13145 [bacterium]